MMTLSQCKSLYRKALVKKKRKRAKKKSKEKEGMNEKVNILSGFKNDKEANELLNFYGSSLETTQYDTFSEVSRSIHSRKKKPDKLTHFITETTVGNEAECPRGARKVGKKGEEKAERERRERRCGKSPRKRGLSRGKLCGASIQNPLSLLSGCRDRPVYSLYHSDRLSRKPAIGLFPASPLPMGRT